MENIIHASENDKKPGVVILKLEKKIGGGSRLQKNSMKNIYYKERNNTREYQTH